MSGTCPWKAGQGPNICIGVDLSYFSQRGLFWKIPLGATHMLH